MKNILAIDYGAKRWGLAHCDELRVVFPMPAITQGAYNERLNILKELIHKHKIDTIVLGLPLSLEGKETTTTQAVRDFHNQIETFGLPIHLVDEGLSSYEASQAMPKKSLKHGLPKRDGKLDSRSAAVILEDFLSQNLL